MRGSLAIDQVPTGIGQVEDSSFGIGEEFPIMVVIGVSSWVTRPGGSVSLREGRGNVSQSRLATLYLDAGRQKES